MARYHIAQLTPSKAEILAGWLDAQTWAPTVAGVDDIEIVGAFRFDDPDGAVGLETHLVQIDDAVFQVPLTYRAAPFDDGHLVSEMHHSVLGSRWVYDGHHDPVMVSMFAAAALTGTGQALGIVEYEERRVVVPTPVRLAGGGWTGGPTPVDGFNVESADERAVTLSSDTVTMQIARHLVDGSAPEIGLTATWPGQDAPVTLATIEPRHPG
ncbi:MAG: hypothetical protein AAFY28_01525 [Actinomycetota bacterium]